MIAKDSEALQRASPPTHGEGQCDGKHEAALSNAHPEHGVLEEVDLGDARCRAQRPGSRRLHPRRWRRGRVEGPWTAPSGALLDDFWRSGP